MIESSLHQFLSVDAPAILAALFASLACALLGNFLVLRRVSLMGDAISHAVLPGIVIGFLVSGSRSIGPVFLGAAAAAILTAVLIDLIKRYGRIESGASMGVVFSIMFALGVLLIEQASARSVDLDADCLLHGQLETIFWFPPSTWTTLLQFSTLKELPQELLMAGGVFTISVALTYLIWKELKIFSFDPALTAALGFNTNFISLLLMIILAAAVVVSFKIVGSILVIGMIICPAAIARFWTDNLKVQVFLSLLFSAFAVVVGYFLATMGVRYIGIDYALSASGMMVTTLGVILMASVIAAPQYGIIGRAIRNFSLGISTEREDMLARLYKSLENEGRAILPMPAKTFRDKLIKFFARRDLKLSGLLINKGLSETGMAEAQRVVRAHRLWEGFLVTEAGLPPDHVHEPAEKLEHYTSAGMASALSGAQQDTTKDPHGRDIPELKSPKSS